MISPAFWPAPTTANVGASSGRKRRMLRRNEFEWKTPGPSSGSKSGGTLGTCPSESTTFRATSWRASPESRSRATTSSRSIAPFSTTGSMRSTSWR